MHVCGPNYFWYIIFSSVRKWYLVIVYLGISVPTYLNYVQIWPMLVGPMCFYALILDHKNKDMNSLSPLSKFRLKGVLLLHFISFSSLSIVSLHLLHPHSPPPSKSSIEGQVRSLEFQDFGRSKGLELRV